MKRYDFNDQWSVRKQGQDAFIEVTLPHDAMIHERRTPDSPSGSAGAFFPGGKYVYEKTFTLPAEWAGESLTLEFEGVYRNSKVFVNDREAGGCCYGYSPFFVPMDALLHPGENTVRVEVDNSAQPNSRWYTGSGIYRPVFLWAGGKTHIDVEGVRITTLSTAPARIHVMTEHNGGEVAVELRYRGNTVARGMGDDLELDIPDAKLWSAETPELYECRVVLTENGAPVDEVSEMFGIRRVTWSPKGLFVNDQETLLRGGCIHHDNGILGACCFEKAERRRAAILKNAGFNAIRSSHNPTSKALLKACDELGLYMIDETWDMWYSRKNKHDYGVDFQDHYLDDIRAMVCRDYNHPSVIMYSIGNEVSEPATQRGVALAKEMVEFMRSLDASRAVTGGINLMIIANSAKGKGIYKEDGGMRDDKGDKMSGMNSTMFNLITSMIGSGMNKAANGKRADTATAPVLDLLDIAGYNYASGRYANEGRLHPNRVLCGSETMPYDIAKNWTMVKKHPFLIGDFMWTAWDYLGEAGIGTWAYTADAKGFNKPYPWLLADVGAFDILGAPNGEALWAQTVWGFAPQPLIAVRPVSHPGVKPIKGAWRGTNALSSWAWRGCDGNRAVVEVYTDATSVVLLLNGKSVGKKKPKSCRATFATKYQTGTLTAVAYNAAGKEIGRSELSSATGKRSICVRPEEAKIMAGDIAFVSVEIVGENGVVECNADEKLCVTVENGELLAFGSANPRTEERFDSGSYTTYYGRAQAVLRAKGKGRMTVRVSGSGMQAVATSIEITEA